MSSELTTTSFLNYRLSTFEKSEFETKRNSKCSQKKLAEAGFYFTPTDEFPDKVTCYACGTDVFGWEKDDDPWTEHQKLRPNCAYLEKKRSYNHELTVQEFIEYQTCNLIVKDELYHVKKKAMEKSLDKIKQEAKVSSIDLRSSEALKANK